MGALVDRLVCEHRLEAAELRSLLESSDQLTFNSIRQHAAEVAQRHFGRRVYIRGLIEVSNYCRNNCFYCGIRRDNRQVERYRLTDEQILSACSAGYQLGFRTFVMQGGEDGAFADNRLVPLINTIHTQYPDCAITLSLGERSAASYRALYEAGARRYLLRHETASPQLYARLHPAEMSWQNRIECIETLKEIGYQTGMGMMIGVPGQTIEHLVQDLMLLQQIRPQMVGIGPFIPHSLTPLGDYPVGSVEMTLRLISIIRLLLPHALIPSTTALATLSPMAQIEGIAAGANVIMPNLSPADVRRNYEIYEGKAAFGTEAAEGLRQLAARLSTINYEISYDIGNYNEEVKI
ncbi:MAG: [FeFe] hydrogenase H-cluster radical SAM maturase HydE [Bacteroidaceae bacterium]|nr:[FeFe] hydrogenase H-cluster radical SAM maturase HydE [Bacteroidaceae bacterium]